MTKFFTVENGARLPVKFGAFEGIAGVSPMGGCRQVAFAAGSAPVRAGDEGTIDGVNVVVVDAKISRRTTRPRMALITARDIAG